MGGGGVVVGLDGLPPAAPVLVVVPFPEEVPLPWLGPEVVVADPEVDFEPWSVEPFPVVVPDFELPPDLGPWVLP